MQGAVEDGPHDDVGRVNGVNDGNRANKVVMVMNQSINQSINGNRKWIYLSIEIRWLVGVHQRDMYDPSGRGVSVQQLLMDGMDLTTL